MRVLYALGYLVWIAVEIVKGSFDVARDALTPGVGSTPAIVEYPLRCRTDLEVTVMASSITITPGTIVLGTASARDGEPPVLYVHSLYSRSRADIIAGLDEMETRLLRATRGRRAGEVQAA